ncbi:hypothetical protein BB560_003530 [Smittium megazygosporum]|uniref:RRM domain-containing protein n=1 Tax=Smittium megazygosporum TaxID=133381 RepID=A0A2T9ZBW1_9FUNG|nr:hypothetical protein BB560_003530 [Smittium megazygosporum]
MEAKLTKKQKKAAKFHKKNKETSNDEIKDIQNENETSFSKTKKKRSKSKTENKNVDTQEDLETQNLVEQEQEEESLGTEQNEQHASDSQQFRSPLKRRYLVFVGNLSFDSTKDELKQFFKATDPTDVRLITDKNTGKSRGFAFVELGSSEALQKALKYHGMKFNGRKINVEYTVGGGGNSETRKNKIQQKRKNLETEREEEASENKTSNTSKSKHGESVPGNNSFEISKHQRKRTRGVK